MSHALRAITAAAAVTLIAPAALAQVVKIDGSSTVYPVTEGIAEDFQKAKKNAIKVTVGISGTGGGFKKFCRGETDVQNASRPILAAEMADCKAAGVEYIELPVAFDALTVVMNPRNTFLQAISVDELKKIWEPAAQGKITKWNQVNPAWPDAPIKLFGAGSDSGTFDYFTEAINGKSKSSRGDYTASEDDNVLVQGVSQDVNAIGYFGYAYYAENQSRLKAVPIVEKAGKPAVSPSEATVLNGSYQPLSRPIFIYVSAKSLAKSEVKEFSEYYMKNAAKIAKEVKYVPLPPQAYTVGLEHIAKMKKGTVMGGKNEVGVRIEDLLAREAKL
jgi:phosphate transport system substrate-binding protein